MATTNFTQLYRNEQQAINKQQFLLGAGTRATFANSLGLGDASQVCMPKEPHKRALFNAKETYY